MDTSNTQGPKGVAGSYGPNDQGYKCHHIRYAALQLVAASEFHVGYSNSQPPMGDDDHVVKALQHLAEADKEVCRFANLEHDPKLFVAFGRQG